MHLGRWLGVSLGLMLPLLPFLATNSIRDMTKFLAPTTHLVPTFSGLPTVTPMYCVAMGKIPLPHHCKPTENKLFPFIHCIRSSPVKALSGGKITIGLKWIQGWATELQLIQKMREGHVAPSRPIAAGILQRSRFHNEPKETRKHYFLEILKILLNQLTPRVIPL